MQAAKGAGSVHTMLCPVRIPMLLFAGCLVLVLVGCSGRAGPQAHMDRASDLLSKGREKQAMIELDKAVKLDPQDPAPQLAAIAMCGGKELWADVVRMAEALIASNAKRSLRTPLTNDELAMIYAMLGEAHWKLRDLRAAEQAMKTALDHAPDSPVFLNALGYFYADEGIRLTQALKLTRRAVALAPDDGMIVDSLGWAQYRLRDYRSAVSTLRRAVELVPDDAELRYHLGAAYAGLGKSAEAIVELKKALVIDRHHPQSAKLLKTLHR